MWNIWLCLVYGACEYLAIFFLYVFLGLKIEFRKNFIWLLYFPSLIKLTKFYSHCTLIWNELITLMGVSFNKKYITLHHNPDPNQSWTMPVYKTTWTQIEAFIINIYSNIMHFNWAHYPQGIVNAMEILLIVPIKKQKLDAKYMRRNRKNAYYFATDGVTALPDTTIAKYSVISNVFLKSAKEYYIHSISVADHKL